METAKNKKTPIGGEENLKELEAAIIELKKTGERLGVVNDYLVQHKAEWPLMTESGMHFEQSRNLLRQIIYNISEGIECLECIIGNERFCLRRIVNLDKKLNNIQDNVHVKFPITDLDCSIWQRGARDFICGITQMLYIDRWEKSCCENFAVRFNNLLANVKKLFDDKSQLDKFISKKRNPEIYNSPKSLIDTVMLTYGKTRDTYYKEVENYLNNYLD